MIRHTYGSKRPAVDVLLAYIPSKNSWFVNNPKYYSNPSPFQAATEDKQQLKLAWAMSTKVFKEGFKPHPEIGWDVEKVKLRQDLKEKRHSL